MGNAISGRRETAEALKSQEKLDIKVLHVGCSDTGMRALEANSNRKIHIFQTTKPDKQ
jgi:hypothetical protein